MDEKKPQLRFQFAAAADLARLELIRFLDRKFNKTFEHHLSFQPYPFVLSLQRIEPHVTGYVDAGRRRSSWAIPAFGAIFGFFALMFLLGAAMPMSGGTQDRAALLGLAIVNFGLAWLLIALGRRQRELVRIFAYHEERNEVAIILMRKSVLIHRVACGPSDAKLMVHKAQFGTRGGYRGSFFWGSGFVLVGHVQGELFVIAAQPKKEQILELWETLPNWLKALDAGEGSDLELCGDRTLGPHHH